MSDLDKKVQQATELLPGAGYPKQKSKYKSVAIKAGLVALAFFISAATFSARGAFRESQQVNTNVCSQVAELIPEKNGVVWKLSKVYFGTPRFKKRAVEWLGGAIRVPTETHDKMQPVGIDPRWETFGVLQDYLLQAFPKVHTALELTKVNTYGLLYEWKGSDASLKPLLLAAHQDVIPVENATLGQWQHEPFSGHFDGEYIWGRGSSDDKHGLIGIMSAVESLLELKFKPTRSVVLAFGIDEEIGGLNGARSLATVMLEKFGPKSFAMLIDEGVGYGPQYGQIFALPGIAEKGTLHIRIDLASPGGHSSVPPPHTSIGMLAKLLVEIEENPFEAHLTRGSPTYKTAQCLAEHGPEMLPALRKNIRLSQYSDEALREAEILLLQNPMFKTLVGTTQSINLIQGGIKTNALPEQAWAVVNHRISTESSLNETTSRQTDLLRPLASGFNLSYTAFGASLSEPDVPAYGSLNLSDAWGTGTEPAPVSPTDENAAPYDLLSGTIKAAYNSHRGIKGDNNVVVSPGIMPGNTDTRHYWKLTDHIFRYRHVRLGGCLPNNPHTVNEGILISMLVMEADNFVEIIRFFTALVLNADESELI
ncbi:hypothetical protein SERLA73DRAFT_46705 [Serpula lacrymans var. lacrymans S7.3]|uniref:Peptidase M20 dimerisation domain-containing protein n=2 Tax=Serpula lacrymans var. lacrymans TaxID=341189 RepID=F8PKA3_SERL3|nr:uncharacterized protein SERLADRAFT_345484 [Serpula lacrymans var. lacrymans S7.9]EGO03557.1 hypothetical protein SERLA73DRAFT_46705 [Serpula lacrymans var. lacrymans S7.3]EGO29366.1 hypothetical protein SERLADRAFT_345484 [Serpula lacrymans var. lacrymans S7.9]